MYKKMFLIGTLISMFLCGTSVFASNLIKNGDFEANDSAWKFDPAEKGAVVFDKQEKHAGHSSLKILHDRNTSYSKAIQVINVKPNTTYIVTGFIKTLQVNKAVNGCGARFFIGDNSGNAFAASCDVEYAGTRDWERFNFSFNSQAQTQLIIIPYLHNSTGTVWFDDVEISEAATKSVVSYQGNTSMTITLEDIFKDDGKMANKANFSWNPPANIFPITFWVAPEITQARMAEVAEAGFTIWMPNVPCSYAQNIKTLDLAYANGIKAFVFDDRLINYFKPESYWPSDETIQKVVNDYKDHPAFYGYLLRDEPSAAHFPVLGHVLQKLQEKDPTHLAYINLFPDYANNLALGTPSEQMGTSSYDEYVSQFLKLHPQILSYDNYLWSYGLYPGYKSVIETDNMHFKNLEIIRKYALTNSVRFWNYIYSQDNLCGSNASFTFEQYSINRQAYSALAYGYTGFSYYTYADTESGNAILKKGKRTYIYDLVKKLNKEIKNIGQPLLDAVSQAVYHVNGTTSDVTRLAGKYVKGDGALVIGTFTNSKGQNLLMFMNKENSTNEVSVNLKGKYVIEQKTKVDEKWTVLDAKVTADNVTKFKLSLEPGSGELIRCSNK